MPNEVAGVAGQHGGAERASEPGADAKRNPGDEGLGDGAALPPVLSVVISQPEEVPDPKGGGVSKCTATIVNDEKKWGLPRCESDHEQCRVCQQRTEEPLMDLGCSCRGELAKAHRSCIEIWFRTRGSNKCEICQQVATHDPSQETQPTQTSYWVWRANSVYGGPNIEQGQRERGSCSLLWVAFSILFGGLLLNILIYVSLGVSALTVNIIIGVLIVLGLGTAFWLALESSHVRGLRVVQRPDTNINPGYHPDV